MKLISFCLWGDNPKYTVGAIKNAILTNEIYPGWNSRFYCSDNVSTDIIDKLSKIDNTQIIILPDCGWEAMFWRFYPASESDVEVMLSRDCDSRLNLREKAAVDEWMISNKSFHVMRDHPWHGTEILGGMWGVKYPKLKNMKDMIEKYIKGNFWQVDQNFLRSAIYPLIYNDCLVHDEFFKYNVARPFPIKREGQQFVGEAFDENDVPNFQHRSMIR